MKFAVYCSDVAGAFDKVKGDRLVEKLRAAGVPLQMLRVIESWVEARTAHVVVDGRGSKGMALRDMVFQGTVFGPPLWNIYYADARAPVRKNGFQEVVYADDLNAFKAFDHSSLAEDLHSDMEQCQKDLHAWGRANQVEFDASKESKHVLATCGRGSGEPFALLGVSFDEGLTMAGALHSLVHEASWKLAPILRTSRYFPRQSSSACTKASCFRTSSTGHLPFTTHARLI